MTTATVLSCRVLRGRGDALRRGLFKEDLERLSRSPDFPFGKRVDACLGRFNFHFRFTSFVNVKNVHDISHDQSALIIFVFTLIL